MTRDGLPVHSWVFRGDTVDVETMAQVKAGNEVPEDVLSRPGRYRTVAPNLEVKEVILGDGERRRSYVVCYNAEEAKRQQAHREQVLAELDAVLPDLRTAGAHSKFVGSVKPEDQGCHW